MMIRSFQSMALVCVLLLPSTYSFTSLRLGQEQRAGGRAHFASSSVNSREFSFSEDSQQKDDTTAYTAAASAASSTASDTKKYDPSDAFIATSTADLAVQALESKANNMLLDLDGHAISPQYLAQAMGLAVGGEANSNLEEFSYMCTDGFHDFNSDACRIHLLLPDGEVKTAFYKHIVFAQLDHAHLKAAKAPYKLLRDCKSYEVVASFLQSTACSLLREKTGIFIPECYHSVVDANYDNPMESRFSFLLQDFGPTEWSQEWLLMNDSTSFAALSTFAKMHAFFWSGSAFWKKDGVAATAAQRELEAAVWKSGSYLEPAKQNVNQCRTVAQEWLLKREKFSEQLSSRSYWDTLGARLESVAEECGRLAHPFALDDDDDDSLSSYQQYRTLTHGDPKAANLFFRESNNKLDVGLIDFQWTGFGLAATDIAHFITSTVHAAELTDNGGEERLLRYYFDQLQAQLTEFGVEDKITFETFMEQYEIAVLDICRLMIAYTWSRFTEPVSPNDQAACARTMNKTSYNKSVPNVVWLLDRCDEILKSRGV